MKNVLVKELMVPLEGYVTVGEGANLYEAVLTLARAQEEYLEKSSTAHSYPHRAILVLDKSQRVVGKVSQLDVLKALEPKYKDIISSEPLARTAASGFSAEFLRGMLERYNLFGKPLHDLCRKAARIKVKEIMYRPTEGEFVGGDDTLEEAVNRLVVGQHQSLLVVKDGEIIGILRLVDVFKAVCDAMKECEF